MKEKIKLIAIISALSLLSAGCVLPACAGRREEEILPDNEIVGDENNVTPPTSGFNQPGEEENEGAEVVLPSEVVTPPTVKTADYIKVTGDGVSIRSGAGVNFTKVGVAEKGVLYALRGKADGWYMTFYKGKTAFISDKYCVVVQMNESANEQVEKVIAEGCKHMGVTYVYGATRYHDGKGNRLSGFSAQAFDCSSLMQYIFKIGAGVNLQVNTRTQVYQGKTVAKGDLKRGDLMFFTNASRKYNTGVERIGHVALYLGDNYILHTASDYAKIEKISTTRWGYFIQAQRVL